MIQRATVLRRRWSPTLLFLGLVAGLSLPHEAQAFRNQRRVWSQSPTPCIPVSIGTPINGRLRCAARLPDEDHRLRQLQAFRGRGTAFATGELIALLGHAAAEVAGRYPGSRLLLGNLSLRRGGFIPFSRSHQSGRDADIVFFARHKGRPVEPLWMNSFGHNLRARLRPHLTFDVARNWALVRALLTHPTVQVQWIIVAPHLERVLLDHAQSLGEPQWLLGRAESVLHQPPGLRQHDNHFHLRIYCSLQDRLSGCQDLPPFWPGVTLHEPAARQRLSELLARLSHPKVPIRLRALRRLIRLEARDLAGEMAAKALRDPSPTIRIRTLEILAQWRPTSSDIAEAIENLLWSPGTGFMEGGRSPAAPMGLTRTLEFPFDGYRHAHQIRLAYRVLAQSPGVPSVTILERGLRSPRRLRPMVPGNPPVPEVLLAAQASRHKGALALVPALLEALDHSDVRVRAAATEALRRLGNHRVSHRSEARRGSPEHRIALATWRSWWSERRDRTSDRLLWDGFVARVPGFAMAQPMARRARLVRLTARNDELGDNAHLLLRKLAGPAVFREPSTGQGRLAYWSRWLRAQGPLRPGNLLEGPREATAGAPPKAGAHKDLKDSNRGLAP